MLFFAGECCFAGRGCRALVGRAVVLSTVAEEDVVPSVAFEDDVVLSDLPELVVEADSVEGVVGVSLSPQAVSATMPRTIARAISKEMIFFICFLLDLFFWE